MHNILWQNAPRGIRLAADTIHIWRASLEQWHDFSETILSAEEIQRGQRFLREEHRRRFCMARGFLRLILAHYLEIAPAQIRFREGAHGKLYLTASPVPLEFNVSHSEDLALYAVTLENEIGIDVEWMNPALEIQPLAARVFTSLECQKLLALSPDQQIPVFYRLWTRKEAYLKALGLGLSGLSLPINEEDAERITSLEPAPGYAGAWALTGRGPINSVQMNYFEINPQNLKLSR